MENFDFPDALKKHQEWLNDPATGSRLEFHGVLERMDLSRANLSGADLSGADLSGADLSGANLSGADMSWTNLSGADMSWTNLSLADLSGADLSRADLSLADLSGANLSGASVDSAKLTFFCCDALDIKADLRLAAQMAYHFCRIDFGACAEIKEAQAAMRSLANKSHVVAKYRLPEIPAKKDENPDQLELGV